MVTHADIVDEARSWIGTRYHHLRRERGEFTDCVGLIIGVARSLGLGDYRRYDYSAIPDPVHMEAGLRAHLEPITVNYAVPGDVLWFAFRYRDRPKPVPVHLGILADHPFGGRSIIHAYSGVGRVTEHRIDVKWARRIHGAWRYRGI